MILLSMNFDEQFQVFDIKFEKSMKFYVVTIFCSPPLGNTNDKEDFKVLAE